MLTKIFNFLLPPTKREKENDQKVKRLLWETIREYTPKNSSEIRVIYTSRELIEAGRELMKESY